MRTPLPLLALTLTLGLPSHAAELSVLSFGGANKAAQEIAFYQPYFAQTGTRVTAGDYNGDYYREIVNGKRASRDWDLVEVSAPELERGCDDGRFQPIDWQAIGRVDDFVPGSASPCGVGIFTWAVVLAYNAERVARAPQNWQDFWNVRSFPGKRGMHKSARYTLEFALMADGVAPRDVYRVLATPAGVERAFRKLTQLRPHIVWWESPAQPAQMLAFDQAVMSVAYNGRVTAAQKDWPKLRVQWQDNLYNINYWAVPKGGNSVEANRFIAFASRPEQQGSYASYIDYGPTRLSAMALLPAGVAARLPSAPANLAHATPTDSAFWLKHGPALEARFTRWLGNRANEG